jgi:hypothetical protein
MDIDLGEAGRIWCPPGFFIDNKLTYNKAMIELPYWTAGPKCGQYKCGPSLTKDEIVKHVLPALGELKDKTILFITGGGGFQLIVED